MAPWQVPMIRRLVSSIVASGLPASPSHPAVAARDPAAATHAVLTADPLDLLLCVEQCWHGAEPFAGPARVQSWADGRFHPIGAALAAPGARAWEHLASSYVLENTRAVQIMGRVVHGLRTGSMAGASSADTRRWLDVTEVLLFGNDGRASSWFAAPSVRASAEAVRRNAYWRLLGLDLAFGTEDNRPSDFPKPDQANTGFILAFEQMLVACWRALSDPRGRGHATRDAVLHSVQGLHALMSSRREREGLDRVELTAAVALGWIRLTLEDDTPVVRDLGAQGSTAAERLGRMGERVGLPAHHQSASLFALGDDISDVLRAVESESAHAGLVAGLHRSGPEAKRVRRVITEWSAATGKDLRHIA